MTKIIQNTNQSTINDYPEGVEVIIHSRKSNFLNFFLACWLVAWTAGEVIIVKKLFSYGDQYPDAFLVVWFCGWALGGMFAVFIGLWNNKGREIVRISADSLKHVREYVLFSRSREYKMQHVKNLRIFELQPSITSMSGGMEFWGLSGGTIAFDYGKITQKFGIGLNEAEAVHIVRAIQSRYENLR